MADDRKNPADDATLTSAGRPAPSGDAEPMPETIGPYRILGKLGEGGMGIVYEAEPLLLEGAEALLRNESAGAERQRKAVERVVRLYEAWGREDHAAAWRARGDILN